MKIQDLTIVLAKKGISTSMEFDSEKNQCYVNLQSNAKSEMHLYEDGVLTGRYDYETVIDLKKDEDVLLYELCEEFEHALHGRGYGQVGWFNLCKEQGVTIETYW